LTPAILKEDKYRPFKDPISAVDRTHIEITVPANQQAPWRNRKQFLNQNVFTAYTFNLRFTYIYIGWEGSAHDIRVMMDTITTGYWRPEERRYYLTDAG